jgi:dTDP-glucose 4,6-dehydratase
MEYQPHNVLVTGGAGFVGANYIQYQLSQNSRCHLINLDALTYAGNLNYLSSVVDNKRYQFVHGNINDAELVAKLLKKYNIDTIVHFAAESHVDRSIARPAAFIETNIIGTFNLLDCAKQYWLQQKKYSTTQCRFHHISTDEVYGSLSSSDAAFTEQTAYQPNSPYSASKASSDHLVRAYYHTYGLPITMSNCSNNYGPYQHSEKFIPTVIKACHEQKPIPLYGDGSNIRDWLYVTDHCNAIDLIIQQGRLGETYNIGGNNELSNLQLAKQICQLFDELKPENKPHENLISFIDDRLGHDWRYAIDNHKITTELGWQPQLDFVANLKNTIIFYLKHA